MTKEYQGLESAMIHKKALVDRPATGKQHMSGNVLRLTRVKVEDFK